MRQLGNRQRKTEVKAVVGIGDWRVEARVGGRGIRHSRYFLWALGAELPSLASVGEPNNYSPGRLHFIRRPCVQLHPISKEAVAQRGSCFPFVSWC
ncbi:hypothetical protein AVEN_241219-1 [Araneus ventricosus]|uniref:Uncharacterized protein n=1 Tax=Araneus ventricosus TaxID=182803 RepID=A0A4Y2D2W6_ARAVE|nr:hypothetical protein AVEN_241219-1 [Araneus ventricosus]